MSTTIVHNDTFGAVIDWGDDDYVEIRWYDATRDMTASQFNDWLTGFATAVESAKRAGVLVDAVQFKMDMTTMDMEYRDAHVIPRYNPAVVTRFAFLMPTGMPAIGAPPAPEGPADFPTAFFASRSEAIDWLHS